MEEKLQEVIKRAELIRDYKYAKAQLESLEAELKFEENKKNCEIEYLTTTTNVKFSLMENTDGTVGELSKIYTTRMKEILAEYNMASQPIIQEISILHSQIEEYEKELPFFS